MFQIILNLITFLKLKNERSKYTSFEYKESCFKLYS